LSIGFIVTNVAQSTSRLAHRQPVFIIFLDDCRDVAHAPDAIVFSIVKRAHPASVMFVKLVFIPSRSSSYAVDGADGAPSTTHLRSFAKQLTPRQFPQAATVHEVERRFSWMRTICSPSAFNRCFNSSER
jgi:hypothetical protein